MWKYARHCYSTDYNYKGLEGFTLTENIAYNLSYITNTHTHTASLAASCSLPTTFFVLCGGWVSPTSEKPHFRLSEEVYMTTHCVPLKLWMFLSRSTSFVHDGLTVNNLASGYCAWIPVGVSSGSKLMLASSIAWHNVGHSARDCFL